ncbi:DmsE family decaheme c-type cytochrome [Ferrimonas balearica]|uniref:DmsE family decaheme c-type cytochrome n=1 Tax=Ferrimonas balearica TaxID=44012 RepID=UPI001C948AD2|nr:DmsE family decaheme c-type cytochrome [Ferrimonas balearica]MBY6108638.1 DmsE family decaheme c-type cytochrome [Ferrimonas balearica]
MKVTISTARNLVLAAILAGSWPALAGSVPDGSVDLLKQKFTEGSYSKRGADGCMMCHKRDPQLAAIFDSVHGDPNGKNTPMAGLQCEACHGPQGKHKGKNEPMLTFGEDSPLTAEMQNSVCLGCHQKGADAQWHGSLHDLEEVSCVSCHQLHVAKDPILNPANQSEQCLSCHTRQQADIHKRSSHPIKWDQMNCTDCHNPHGGIGPAATEQPTVNDGCYQCHADKRGPMLWNHAPVMEDCTICHTPHGSVNDNLLTSRVPMLCKQCHGDNPHAGNVPGGNSSINTAGQGCLNCHSQIHGSNHPNGAKFQF